MSLATILSVAGPSTILLEKLTIAHCSQWGWQWVLLPLQLTQK
jgi:hypothetical protein